MLFQEPLGEPYKSMSFDELDERIRARKAELGSRLVDSVRENCPGVGKVEIFFVTSAREDIEELNEIVGPARSKLRKLQAFGRAEDGTYECDTSLDCTVCPEKTVCDTIRDVITIRKGDRIITFGGDGGEG